MSGKDLVCREAWRCVCGVRHRGHRETCRINVHGGNQFQQKGDHGWSQGRNEFTREHMEKGMEGVHDGLTVSPKTTLKFHCDCVE